MKKYNDMKNAFEYFKQTTVTTHILEYSMGKGHVLFDSNTNNLGLGTTYLQMQNGWTGYFSKGLASRNVDQ